MNNQTQVKKHDSIVIIGGFLGSGKTTLLKRLIDHEFSNGRQPQVIMSEFGDFDVDSQIIADERLQITSVISGCICCSNRDELARAFTKMLEISPERPLFIETTGVADPGGVLKVIGPIADARGAVINKVAVVYDASKRASDRRDHHLIEEQLMTADLIILNKCDLAGDSIENIEREVRSINPVAQVTRAVSCNIDPGLLTQGATKCVAIADGHVCDDEEYTSFSFKVTSRLKRTAFERWLKSLPPEVLRLKGFVLFNSENGFFEVQWTRGDYDITAVQPGRWMDATLVLISHPMPGNDLVRTFQDCLSTGK